MAPVHPKGTTMFHHPDVLRALAHQRRLDLLQDAARPIRWPAAPWRRRRRARLGRSEDYQLVA
jgi:hypothetical protein